MIRLSITIHFKVQFTLNHVSQFPNGAIQPFRSIGSFGTLLVALKSSLPPTLISLTFPAFRFLRISPRWTLDTPLAKASTSREAPDRSGSLFHDLSRRRRGIIPVSSAEANGARRFCYPIADSHAIPSFPRRVRAVPCEHVGTVWHEGSLRSIASLPPTPPNFFNQDGILTRYAPTAS